MLAGLSEVGELIELTSDPRETPEEGVGGFVVPRPRDRPEGRLTDEARRRPPADSCPLGDAGELLRVEANQLGSGAALRHVGPRQYRGRQARPLPTSTCLLSRPGLAAAGITGPSTKK